jgi:hypothetical protein
MLPREVSVFTREGMPDFLWGVLEGLSFVVGGTPVGLQLSSARPCSSLGQMRLAAPISDRPARSANPPDRSTIFILGNSSTSRTLQRVEEGASLLQPAHFGRSALQPVSS